MADLNVMPLLLTIREAFEAKAADLPFTERALSACVHAWMEGHVAAPGHHLDRDRVQGMPHPPFPDPRDERLQRILREVGERFEAGEEPAAIAYAAALGWRAGRQAGLDCPGCAPEGFEHPMSRAMRSGRIDISFRETPESPR